MDWRSLIVDSGFAAAGGTAVLSGLATLAAALGLTALSTRSYRWLVTDDTETVIPALGVAYPLIILSATAVGVLVGICLGSMPAWIILLGVVAAVVFYVARTGNAHLAAFKAWYWLAFPSEYRVLLRWAITLLLVGMGFITARGIHSVLPDSLTGILVGISGAAVLGVLLPILLYYPIARSEQLWLDDIWQTQQRSAELWKAKHGSDEGS